VGGERELRFEDEGCHHKRGRGRSEIPLCGRNVEDPSLRKRGVWGRTMGEKNGEMKMTSKPGLADRTQKRGGADANACPGPSQAGGVGTHGKKRIRRRNPEGHSTKSLSWRDKTKPSSFEES